MGLEKCGTSDEHCPAGDFHMRMRVARGRDRALRVYGKKGLFVTIRAYQISLSYADYPRKFVPPLSNRCAYPRKSPPDLEE
jgi:hypothetical protein